MEKLSIDFAGRISSLVAVLSALALSAPAQTVTTVFNFPVTGVTGGGAYAGLLRGSDGRLYGTLSSSGSFGQIFAINPDGTDFQSLGTLSSTTGSAPIGALLETGGKLFATTFNNGASSQGSIVSVHPDGTGLQNVHSFAGNPSDGAKPFSGLLLASDGKFYGTTSSGGASNGGCVYAINSDGTGFSIVLSFAAGSDPTSPVIEVPASSGKLYGTTSAGGANGKGRIFAVSKNGSSPVTLHDFAGADGQTPYDGLTLASDGYLYGTTSAGGANGKGTLFRIATTGGTSFQTLHDFTGADGDNPVYGGLLQASDGRLYGVTNVGGDHNKGTLFRIDVGGGNFQVLHSFAGTDGQSPYGRLLETSPGTFNGTTQNGGTTAKGVIFKLVMPAPPVAAPAILTLKPAKRRIITTQARCTIRGTATDTSGTAPRVFVQTGATQGKRAKGSFHWSFRTRVLPLGRTKFNIYADDPANLSSVTYHVVIIRKAP